MIWPDQLENIGARMDIADQPSVPDALAKVLREALMQTAHICQLTAH